MLTIEPTQLEAGLALDINVQILFCRIILGADTVSAEDAPFACAKAVEYSLALGGT